MLSLKLIPRKRSEEVLVLSFGMGFRVFFYGLALFFLVFLLTDYNSPGSNIGPIVIILVCFLCGSYHESWIFDKGNKTIEQRSGLIFLFIRRRLSMDEIESVMLSSVQRGFDQRESDEKTSTSRQFFLKLSLISRNKKVHNIETIKSGNIGSLGENAELIASFCGVSVVNG